MLEIFKTKDDKNEKEADTWRLGNLPGIEVVTLFYKAMGFWGLEMSLTENILIIIQRIVIMIIFVIPMIGEIKYSMESANIIEVANRSMWALMSLHSCITILLFLQDFHDMKIVLNSLQEFWMKYKNVDDFKDVMVKGVKYVRIWFYPSLFVPSFVYVVHSSIMPIYFSYLFLKTGQVNLIYSTNFEPFLDTSTTRDFFICTVLLTIYGLYLGAINVVQTITCIVLANGVMMNMGVACRMLENINRFCEDQEDLLIKRKKKVDMKNNRDAEVVEKMKDFVKLHQSAIRIAEKMADSQSKLLFLQNLFRVFYASMNIFFSAMIIGKDWSIAAAYLVFSMLVIAQIFIYCWVGQQVIDQSTYINDAVKNIPWYNYSRHVKFMINIVSLRTDKECKIWAWKFYHFDLNTFKNFMITTYSYFTLLKTIFDGK